MGASVRTSITKIPINSPRPLACYHQAGGLKRRTRIEDDKVGGRMKEVRAKALAEKREKPGQPTGGDRGQRTAGAEAVPACYAEMDSVDQEYELRRAVNGPDYQLDEVLPQNEPGARPTSPTSEEPESVESSYFETVAHLKGLQSRGELRFLRDCSPHLSSYITGVALQDLRAGICDKQLSVDKALQQAQEQGVPSLQLDAQQARDTHRRTGRLVDTSPHPQEAVFGCPEQMEDRIVTKARIAHSSWDIWDFGDSLPTKPGDPLLDVYNPGPAERNKCLAIHLAAAILWAPGTGHLDPTFKLDHDAIHRLGRDLRYRQYQQVDECLPSRGTAPDTESLANAELRAHAHDLSHAHHDRDRRSIVCFPPEELPRLNLAIVRFLPS